MQLLAAHLEGQWPASLIAGVEDCIVRRQAAPVVTPAQASCQPVWGTKRADTLAFGGVCQGPLSSDACEVRGMVMQRQGRAQTASQGMDTQNNERQLGKSRLIRDPFAGDFPVPSRTSQYWMPFAAAVSCSHCGTESAAASCGLVAAGRSPACNMSSPVQPGKVGPLACKPPAYAGSSAIAEFQSLHCCKYTCRNYSCQESAALQSRALVNAVLLAVCPHHWSEHVRP